MKPNNKLKGIIPDTVKTFDNTDDAIRELLNDK